MNDVSNGVLFEASKKRNRLQIDRTIVKGKFNVLMVTLSHRGRALPLMWTLLPHSGSCSRKEWSALLKRVDQLLSRHTKVIVLGDREFGTADLIQFCKHQGWDCVLRVKRTYTVANPHRGFPFAYRWLERQILLGRSCIPDCRYVFGQLT